MTSRLSEALKSFNERFALWVVTNVGTMACAYLFAVIALLAFPQAIHDSFATGFAPLPLVTWLSQSLLQLVLLSIILVGQDIQARGTRQQSTEEYNAIMEMLGDIREAHDELQEIVRDVTELLNRGTR